MEGELIHKGILSSVVLSITNDHSPASRFQLESRVHTHSDEFHIYHIIVYKSTVCPLVLLSSGLDGSQQQDSLWQKASLQQEVLLKQC